LITRQRVVFIFMSTPADPTSSTTQPGWYHDGHSQRWWDGTQWGQYAPQQPFQYTGPATPPVDSNDKTLAVLAHLGMLFGGVIVPLIMYLIANDRERPMTRAHAREALNFQITFMIVYFGAFILLFAAIIPSMSSDQPPIAFFIVFPLIFVLWFIAIGFSIAAAIKASQGKPWRYPVSFRFIKG
jgi:uncharacterized protein